MKTLTLKELNRITLSKHYLISKSDEVLEVISRICGLNAQVAPSPYLSLWNRVSGFAKVALEKELYGTKRTIKSWFMRGTVHIIPTDEYPIYRNALKRSMLRDWNRTLERVGGPSPPEVAELIKGILEALEEDPLTKREVGEKMGELLARYEEREGRRLLSRTIRGLSYQGLLCHAQPTGPWYHFRENRFARIDRWFHPLKEIDENQAKRELLLRYFRGYGPATVQDFAYWAGLRVSEARGALALARDELVEVEVEGAQGQFWSLEEDLDGGQFDEPPPHLLPAFDPLLMGHKDKSRILNPGYKSRVFLPLADVAPVILVGGMVVGTWSHKKGKDHLIMEICPFNGIGGEQLSQVRAEAEALSAFMGFGPLSLEVKLKTP